MGLYGDCINSGASIKWPFEELQVSALACWLPFSTYFRPVVAETVLSK